MEKLGVDVVTAALTSVRNALQKPETVYDPWEASAHVETLVRAARSSPTKRQTIHRIHKWRKRGKKLVPSHESEALQDKQKLQMKTFSELAESLARIPPNITLYALLFKYNYVGCLLLLMFSNDLLFAIKRVAYIFKETG